MQGVAVVPVPCLADYINVFTIVTSTKRGDSMACATAISFFKILTSSDVKMLKN